MKLRFLALCICVLAVASTGFAADAKSPVKAGKWEFSMQMEIPGLPMKMPPIKVVHCVTEEDAKSAIPQDQKNKDCKLGDYKVDGNTVTWTIDCPKQKMTGNGEITYTDNAMDGKMVMKSEGQEFTTTYSGKYLGSCEK